MLHYAGWGLCYCIIRLLLLYMSVCDTCTVAHLCGSRAVAVVEGGGGGGVGGWGGGSVR